MHEGGDGGGLLEDRHDVRAVPNEGDLHQGNAMRNHQKQSEAIRFDPKRSDLGHVALPTTQANHALLHTGEHWLLALPHAVLVRV